MACALRIQPRSNREPARVGTVLSVVDGVGDDPRSEDPELSIRMPPEFEAGVWSNFAIVRHSPYEFTLDFIRLDFAGAKPTGAGVVVQRVNMSPQFVEQLIAALNENMAKYAANSVPAGLESLGDDING